MSSFRSISRILGKSASWSLWRQLPRAELGVVRRAAIVAGSSRAQVDHLALHEALDAEPHSQHAADGGLWPRAASMMPARLALITPVGPPLWPMIALP